MKKYFAIVIALATLASACSDNQAGDKRSELEKLKKEQAELSAKIKALEKEIALTDTTAGKTKLVEVLNVQPDSFFHYIDIQGKVDADQNVTVSPQMMGSIKAIYVREGDNVSAGQVLAEIDDQVMRQGVEELKTQLQLAQQLFTKQENLWKQNIGSEVQYLQAKTQKEALEQKLKTLQEQLALYKITSPINGSVDDVGVKLGQAVAPGLPAFRVVNTSRLKVEAEVAERFASSVKEGSHVMVYFPDLKKEVSEKIAFRSKAISSLNRTFTVHVDLDEYNADYHPNMIAVMKITDYQKTNALVVPQNTVQESEEGAYVFVVDRSAKTPIAKRVGVTLGQSYNGKVEIVDGLNAGDEVITTGYEDLNNGVAVSVASSSAVNPATTQK
jgi:membrane fusion protein, multidrug efflux system